MYCRARWDSLKWTKYRRSERHQPNVEASYLVHSQATPAKGQLNVDPQIQWLQRPSVVRDDAEFEVVSLRKSAECGGHEGQVRQVRGGPDQPTTTRVLRGASPAPSRDNCPARCRSG